MRDYNDQVVVDEQDDERATTVLGLFFKKRKQRRIDEERKRLIPLSLVMVVLVGALAIGAGYFTFFANPITSAPTAPQVAALDNPPAQPADNSAQPQAELDQPQEVIPPSPVEPVVEEVVIQPTVNPMLVAGNPEGAKVSTEILVSKFNEKITTHIEPANVGLIPPQSGNPVFDSVVAMKYSYGNTDSLDQMNAVMQNSGDYIKAEANNGNEFAVALRQATFEEFGISARNAIANIPNLTENELLPAANDFGYYTTGMWYLASTPEEYAVREGLVNEAAGAFAARVQEIEAQKAELVTVTDPQTNTGPSDLPSVNPAGQENPQPAADALPDAAPAVNPDPDPNANPNPAPETENTILANPEAVAPDLTAITVQAPTLTNYDTFPVAIAAPLKGFSGWSLNPEGVVLAIQQLAALLKTGSAGAVDEWVVWSTYGLDTPLGKAWLFSLVELTTVQARWGEMSSMCQDYLGPLLENPATPNAWDLRQRWGLNSCANFRDGPIFNEGKSMLDVTYPSGVTEYYLHYGPDERIDMMGAIWFGFGEDFPLKVGHRIRPRSLVNLGEGLIKGLLNLP